MPDMRQHQHDLPGKHLRLDVRQLPRRSTDRPGQGGDLSLVMVTCEDHCRKEHDVANFEEALQAIEAIHLQLTELNDSANNFLSDLEHFDVTGHLELTQAVEDTHESVDALLMVIGEAEDELRFELP
jgi:hypothetical protein